MTSNDLVTPVLASNQVNSTRVISKTAWQKIHTCSKGLDVSPYFWYLTITTWFWGRRRGHRLKSDLSLVATSNRLLHFDFAYWILPLQRRLCGKHQPLNLWYLYGGQMAIATRVQFQGRSIRTVSPTDCNRYGVSSELCCSSAKPRVQMKILFFQVLKEYGLANALRLRWLISNDRNKRDICEKNA